MRSETDLAVDVVERSPLWRERVADLDPLCAATARAALAASGGEDRGACELSIVLADDALLRALNAKWRGIDKPTNVLAFAAEDAETPPGAPRLLGDVVIAFETMAREALAQVKPLDHHLRHLIVHGVLHLLGWDHEDPAEAERMEALEVVILQRLDVPDPYRMSEASHG
ncbi:MAG TPA: rRNA maturation RNase YbeY [Stellaceae bacterium]|nr:rRNA maturation RNase YbeY [Stellaceae bacterium]